MRVIEILGGMVRVKPQFGMSEWRRSSDKDGIGCGMAIGIDG